MEKQNYIHISQANLNLFKMNLDRGATYLFPCSKYYFSTTLAIATIFPILTYFVHCFNSNIIECLYEILFIHSYYFPVFALFNICYWVHYLVIMPNKNTIQETSNRGEEQLFLIKLLLCTGRTVPPHFQYRNEKRVVAKSKQATRGLG